MRSSILPGSGTGSWRSFSGRLPNALENIKLAISNAKEYGAEGILQVGEIVETINHGLLSTHHFFMERQNRGIAKRQGVRIF